MATGVQQPSWLSCGSRHDPFRTLRHPAFSAWSISQVSAVKPRAFRVPLHADARGAVDLDALDESRRASPWRGHLAEAADPWWWNELTRISGPYSRRASSRHEPDRMHADSGG